MSFFASVLEEAERDGAVEIRRRDDRRPRRWMSRA